MRTAFANGTVKTAFQLRTDFSLTTSFSTLLDELPTERTASVNALTAYKENLLLKNYRGSYKRTILNIIDQLVTAFSIPPKFAIQTFNTIKMTTSVKLTVNELYQGYLDGTNDGTGIDEIMLSILDEIKSASMV
jgi:hypothetical protein